MVRMLIEVEEGGTASVGGKRRRVQDRVMVTNKMCEYSSLSFTGVVLEIAVDGKAGKPKRTRADRPSRLSFLSLSCVGIEQWDTQ